MKHAVPTFYAGIDLHKKYSYITIMDNHGYVQAHQRHEHNKSTLIPALQEYNTPDRKLYTTVEATYGWYWLADQLDAARIAVSLAHTAKVKAVVGKKKTDKEDSKALADLLRCNLLPMAYIPTTYERSLRELLRFRMQLVQQRGTIKRRLHDVLRKQNIECTSTDILGVQAQSWLRSLACPYPYGQEIESCLALAHTYNEQLDIVTKDIQTKATLDDTAKLLMTIPGIGVILGITLAVEIGDVTRFANDRALASYAGVVPSVSSSGGKTHYGSVSKHGNPYIRWALAEAMVHILKKDKGMDAFYQRLKERKGTGKAKVAVMNKMMRAIYAMLKKQSPYRHMENNSDTQPTSPMSF
jgi:transposase